MLTDPTAAVIVIGNEILSGKVDDQNARYLIGQLRALGVSLRRIEVIPDAVDDIARTVRAMSPAVDHVFTSGGVGPTHDDVTLQAVAAAFDMPIARNAELEGLMRARWGEGVHPRDLRMADIPAGARLEHGPGASASTWPVVVVHNVWVLPGVPSIFRRKFEAIRELFRARPIHGRALYSIADEADIAGALDETVAGFPTVDVGSYPQGEGSPHRVKVTFDSRDRTQVDAALDFLAGRLGRAVAQID